MPMYDLQDSVILEMLKYDKDHITELSKRIEALGRVDGKLYHIEQPGLFNTAFTWDPVTIELVDANRVLLLGAIRTFHTCGYHMLVKPTIAEVLVQIPEEYIDEVEAFESLVYDPVVKMHLTGEFYGHSLTTLLYKYQ